MISLPELTSASYCSRARSRFLTLFLLLLLSCLVAPKACEATVRNQTQSAVDLLEQEDFVSALELLHDLESKIPNPDEVSGLLAFAYLGRGYQLLASNDFSAARDAFTDGRLYNDEDPRLWQGEALAIFQQGQYAEAASLLQQALGVAPQNADLFQLLGKAYYADGRMAEALDSLTKSQELGGDVDGLVEKVQREWYVEQGMGQESRGHFQLSFVDNGRASDLASDILDTLEDAYAELGTALNYYPDVRVPVLVYAHRDFSAVTSSPDWAGAVYDGKIRLPVGGMQRVTDQLTAMLYHEYSHVLVHFLTNRHAPVWINEGLAEVAGRSVYAEPLLRLSKAVETDRLLDWEPLAGSFSAFDDDKARLAYEQSYSMVHFMINRFGWHKMSELLKVLGTRQKWQAAIAVVYEEYGLDWPAILVEWQASLGRSG